MKPINTGNLAKDLVLTHRKVNALEGDIDILKELLTWALNNFTKSAAWNANQFEQYIDWKTKTVEILKVME